MLDELLFAGAQQPYWLALALFAATFVAEDVATIAAGGLAAQTHANPALALTAVILGTAAGDLALYALGRWGGRTQLGRRLRARSDVQQAERWVVGRTTMLVFAARFMPGTRLPVFTASGLVAAPFATVAGIIALTTPLWTGALFAIAWIAGEAGAQQFVAVMLPLGALFSGAVFLLRRTTPLRRAAAC